MVSDQNRHPLCFNNRSFAYLSEADEVEFTPSLTRDGKVDKIIRKAQEEVGGEECNFSDILH